MWRKTAFIVLLFLGGMVILGAGEENAATIQGTAYYWFDLEPLPKTVVEIDTTPSQTMVATDGTYEFEVPLGSYTIKAMYYSGNVLLYYAEENVDVLEPGTYQLDLILFPLPEENSIEDNEIVPQIETPAEGLGAGIAILIGVFSLAAVLAYYGVRRRPPKLTEPVRVVGLPADLSAVISILRQHGGRMEQRELRRLLKCSEAKLSLMLADLESRGLVRKIKRGRGNIVVLTEL